RDPGRGIDRRTTRHHRGDDRREAEEGSSGGAGNAGRRHGLLTPRPKAAPLSVAPRESQYNSQLPMRRGLLFLFEFVPERPKCDVGHKKLSKLSLRYENHHYFKGILMMKKDKYGNNCT